MRRISSLPTAEHCPKVDKIGQEVETTASARSTVFHEYCDTGKWNADFVTLPESDQEEILKWKVPMPFVYTVNGVTHALQYKNAKREMRVAVDKNFKAVEVLTFAVKDGNKSLQLHGYGLAACAATGLGRYLTAIWDASDGRYHVASSAVEVDGFEAADIMTRIRIASTERDGNFRTGTHCAHCWKRSHCPAHLIDVPESEFKAILSGDCLEKDVREALIKVKQMEDLRKRVDGACKMWVQNHGPVRSEDGKKWWRCELRKRPGGLDQEAVCRALGEENLDKYKKPAGESAHHDWRNID